MMATSIGPPTVPILLSRATLRRKDVILIIDSANNANSSMGSVETDWVIGYKYCCWAFLTILSMTFEVILLSSC